MTDGNECGSTNSEKIFQDWDKYYKKIGHDKSESMVDVTNGTKIDWKANGAPGSTSTKDLDGENNANGNGSNRRWVFAMRHGERVDFTFGQWVPHCFDENGTYTRKDLNMPVTLPERAGGKESYAKDTPLTRFGLLQAELVGEGLRLAGIKIDHIYSSPALRCVQTSQAFLKGLQADPSVKIKVEPGLFEFKLWYVNKGLVPFMTLEGYHKAGYNVDLSYKPYVELDIQTSETLEEFYDRTQKTMHAAVMDTEQKGGNLIFSAHGCAPEMMVHAIKRLSEDRKEYPPYQLSMETLRKVPYCAFAAMKTSPWEVVPPPCPPSMNSSAGRFDWKMLLEMWNNL